MTNAKREVILVNLYNTWRGPSSDKRVPLGMLYLGGSLKRAGYGVRAYHIPEMEIDRYIKELPCESALFVAVTSVMTGYSLRAAMTFSRRLKQRCPSLPIIWGGVQPSAIPELCLQEDYVDGVGIGEGEHTIVEIAKAYEGKVEFRSIQGYAFKTCDQGILINPSREFIVDLDSVPPDYSLINLDDYLFENGQITGLLMSSRGCPYQCSFCYNNRFNRRRWRAHSEDFVLETILALRKTCSFSQISFSDDHFLADKKRGFSILKKLRHGGIRVYSLDLRIKGLRDEDVKELSEDEVISIFFGTESLNDRLIRLIQKEQTKEDVINGLIKLDRFPEMNVQTEILLGLPFETREEMMRDIRDGLDLYRHHRNLSLYFGVLFPLPNTQMFDEARKNGFHPSSLRDFSEIDLCNAWRLSPQWLPWADRKITRNLYWTERYSERLQINRVRKRRYGGAVVEWMERIDFGAAKFRLTHQFFLGANAELSIHRLRIRLQEALSRRMPSLRRTIKRCLPIDRKINYRNFGYIPSGSPRDLLGKFMGHVNLFKRLQARQIMMALDIQGTDHVLDVGCGAGYFTVEMAKVAREACGIDVTPFLRTIQIPPLLAGKLSFVLGRAERLPFRDNVFDRVLASEILPMAENPHDFLTEMWRVMKEGGRLVLCNGAGHPALKRAYQGHYWALQVLKKIYGERVPHSYEAYCSLLQESFGTHQEGFLGEDDLTHLLRGAGFEPERITYSPGYTSGAFLSWHQFILWLRKGRTLSQKGFHLLYPIASVINRLEKSRYEGGVICAARKN